MFLQEQRVQASQRQMQVPCCVEVGVEVGVEVCVEVGVEVQHRTHISSSSPSYRYGKPLTLNASAYSRSTAGSADSGIHLRRPCSTDEAMLEPKAK